MKPFYWNDLALLPQRAVWSAAERTLFVADVHIGKAATFRAAGLPAPTGTTRENLARLDALIEMLQPKTIVALGDLFHAREAYRDASKREFLAWRGRHARLAIRLVLGNHDAHAGAPPDELGLEVVSEPHTFGVIKCRHHPLETADLAGPYVLAGHAHPVTRLRGPAHDSVRLPCFVMRGRQLILPAFGEFTGGRVVEADAETALCIIAGEQCLYAEMTTARLCRQRR
jgi:DNA ligase-associated metallophosphoesterase